MINESSGAATKDTQSVDERHKVYEEQRGCTKGYGVKVNRINSRLSNAIWKLLGSLFQIPFVSSQ